MRKFIFWTARGVEARGHMEGGMLREERRAGMIFVTKYL
jgi:hypothetical protein